MSKQSHPEIIVSALSRRLTDRGTHIDVQIYRLDDQQRWTLEIVDEYGASTIWNEWFDTDQAALEKVVRAVSAFGINSFLDDSRSKPTYH